jgi:hypothetical protein
MRDLWSKELTEQETERLLKAAAREIKRRKLEAPAILFAEMHKPLANVAGNAAIVLSPYLVPFLGFEHVDDYSQLLSKRENLERLIRLLEGPEENLQEKKKEPEVPEENQSGT